jgi:hypothetical protein
MYIMNPKSSSPLKKALLFTGALFLGWAVNAQTSASGSNMSSDTTHRSGMHRVWNGRSGQAGFRHNGFGGPGGKDWAHRDGRDGFRSRGRDGWAGRGPRIRYTPEQRTQVMAINKDYHQKAEDLYKKDNITLKEYKTGLVALQQERKGKLEALLTQQQKDERTARMKRMSENVQVMQAAHLERLKLRLNLSDDQVAKIKAGAENSRSQLKALHENDNLLPQQKREQMKDLMAKQKETIKSVLTPEQLGKFEEMSRHRRFGPEGPGRHRRPGGDNEEEETK